MDTMAKLIAYTTPPTNYLGAALFLGYIASALYLTLSITWALHRRYAAIFHAEAKTPPSPSPRKKTKNKSKAGRSADAEDSSKDWERADVLAAMKAIRRRHIQIYAFLAGISFAALAYHMVNFLVGSFGAWYRVERGGGVRLVDVRVQDLKSWVLGTNLFADFAGELVGDGASSVWTQGAVLGHWFWGVWMGARATERGFTTRDILPYVLLGQILPPSFTVALFVVKLHLEAPDLQAEQPNANSAQQVRKIKKRASLTLPTLLLNASLLALPPLKNHMSFIWIVLLARFVLWLPFSGWISLRDNEVLKSITVSGGFVVANFGMLRKTVKIWDVARGLQTSGSAVGALGWDAIIGVAVSVVLSWGGGV